MNNAKQAYLTIFFSNLLFLSSLGTVIVTFPVILNNNGLGETFIGFSSVTELLAGIAIAPFLRKLSKKIPANRLIAIAMILYAALILLVPNYINPYIWLLLISIFGVCWFSYFVLSFAILNQHIEGKKRGFATACMTLAISLGITLGTAMANILGAENYLLFIYSSFVAILIAILFLNLKHCTAKIEEEQDDKNKFSHIIKKHPEIFLGKFFQEYVSHMIFIFMVIFGIRNGFTAEQAALIVSFYTFSSVIDMLIGLLADKVNRIKIITYAIPTSTLLVFGLFYFATNYYALLATIFLLGIVSGFLYISISAELNSSFKKHELVHANSCLSFVANIGGLVSSIFTGILLEQIGNIGIFLPVFFLFILFLVFKITKYIKHA